MRVWYIRLNLMNLPDCTGQLQENPVGRCAKGVDMCWLFFNQMAIYQFYIPCSFHNQMGAFMQKIKWMSTPCCGSTPPHKTQCHFGGRITWGWLGIGWSWKFPDFPATIFSRIFVLDTLDMLDCVGLCRSDWQILQWSHFVDHILLWSHVPHFVGPL